MSVRTLARAVALGTSLALGACRPSGETSGAAGEPRFVDRAREAGLEHRHERGAGGRVPHLFETMGGGCAWLDHDGDGDLDLYLTSGQRVERPGDLEAPGRCRLYRNEGGRYVDCTREAGLAGRGYALGAATGDVDGDGSTDLYLIRFGPNLLFRNRGDGTFEEVREHGAEGAAPFSGGAAIADFDLDGRPDIYVASYVTYDLEHPERCWETPVDGGQRIPIYCGPVSYRGAPDRLYRNVGGGRFEDVSARCGVTGPAVERSKSLGVLAADLDDDQDVDIYVACDTTANLLWRNRGDGTFEEVGLPSGVATSSTGMNEGGMGIAFGDVDGDLRGDLLVTNFAEESNRVYLGQPDGGFLDGTARLGLGRGSRFLVGWGTAFFDAGNDGTLEVVVANGHIYDNAGAWLPEQTWEQPNSLYAPAGPGIAFRECSAAAGPGFAGRASYRGLAVADDDGDGDLDLVVTALDRPPRLLRQEGRADHWLAVRLVGAGPGGHDAVGARIVVRAGGRSRVRWRTAGGSYLSEHSPRAWFGLGEVERAGRVEVRWPGGGTTLLEDVPADRELVVRRESGAEGAGEK